MNNKTNDMPVAKSVGRKFRNDLIFTVALLVLASAVGLSFFFLRGEGNTVSVTVDGVLFGSYPLSQDTEVEIRTGVDGENVNLLVIRDGKASVTHASCPDGICAAHRPISRNGESIVCLPHRVAITISTVETDGPDIIV